MQMITLPVTNAHLNLHIVTNRSLAQIKFGESAHRVGRQIKVCLIYHTGNNGRYKVVNEYIRFGKLSSICQFCHTYAMPNCCHIKSQVYIFK